MSNYLSSSDIAFTSDLAQPDARPTDYAFRQDLGRSLCLSRVFGGIAAHPVVPQNAFPDLSIIGGQGQSHTRLTSLDANQAIDEFSPNEAQIFMGDSLVGPYNVFTNTSTLNGPSQQHDHSINEVEWALWDGIAYSTAEGGIDSNGLPISTFSSSLSSVPFHHNAAANQVFRPIAPATALSGTLMPPMDHPGFNAAATQSAQQARIHCDFPGCTRTFRRAGDCRRHMGKHQARTFNCIDVECEKRFYRLDKLRDHLRQGHGITL